MQDEFLWWRDGVIYQIYPRSFSDSNGDGLGDLRGILGKLDYIAELGVDAIWLSPIYPSPDADFGYDIADHCAIDPRFGTIADFDELVNESHRRGIRVVLDMVMNHTSERHQWFVESRSSTVNAKRDWYLWQKSIPNNWQSQFGGGGWQRDDTTGEYYFHMFAKEQPDVNWRNPKLRDAQLDVFRYWLKRGVDGFRLDVFNAYFKDSQFRNNPPRFGLRAFDRQKHINDIDQPEMMPLLKQLRGILDSYPQTYAVGETFIATPQQTAAYCGNDKLHAAFNFDFTFQPYDPARFRDAIDRWNAAVGTEIWPNYVLSNHDQPRSATRYCRGEDDARAKIAIAMLLTLRGTPFLYYGEEIGMRDISMKRSEILDPPGKIYWPLYKGRDGCRSPMQWNDSTNAGFTTGKPWLKTHPDYKTRNVESQKRDPDSLWNFTKRLIGLRKQERALQAGELMFCDAPKGMLRYTRSLKDSRLTVCLNFTMRFLSVPVSGELLLANCEAEASKRAPMEVSVWRTR